MTRATLADLLQPAMRDGYAVAGLVCLGWEDSRAFVAAAEAERSPVILQAGPGCRKHTPLPVIGAMFRFLADQATVPVALHLDHGTSMDEVKEAIREGFTSVMFDGSALQLHENIEKTRAIADFAHNAGVSCEGEIGFVGYAGGASSAATDPQEAALFARESGVDAMAIAVGNVHLQKNAGAELNERALKAISEVTGKSIPLVIHGGSGVPVEQRTRLAAASLVAKFNIGTELRMAFGQALRNKVNDGSEEFDRIALLNATESPLTDLAKRIFRHLGSSNRHANK